MSALLVRSLIDPRFDGEESPNPNPQERDTRHQRQHTQCLNAGQLQPPHSRNTNNEKPHRGPDVRQQRALVRQLSPLPSQPVSNRCVQFLGHGRSAILAETIPLQRAKLNRPGEKAGRRREGAHGRGGQQRLPTPLICPKRPRREEISSRLSPQGRADEFRLNKSILMPDPNSLMQQIKSTFRNRIAASNGLS